MNTLNDPISIMPPSSVSQIILSETMHGITNYMIDNTIDSDVWTKLNTGVVSNGYAIEDGVRSKAKIIPAILKVVNSFWTNVDNYEQQGYKLTGFHLNVQFKSSLAQTEINYNMLTSATHRKLRIVRRDMLVDEPYQEEHVTNFHMDQIPVIIDHVRKGTISEDFPCVSRLEEELEKDPDWTGENLASLSTSKSLLHLFQLKIVPTLFFEAIQPESTNQLSDDKTDLTIAQSNCEIYIKSNKSVSGGSSLSFSLFRNSLSWTYKNTQTASNLEDGQVLSANL